MPEPISIPHSKSSLKKITLENVNNGAAADIFRQYLATIEEDLKTNESVKPRIITLRISIDRKDIEDGYVNVNVSGAISLPKIETIPLKAKATSTGIMQELPLEFGD